jgi:hypothetical protein
MFPHRAFGRVDIQCFSRCSLPGLTSLRATSLKLHQHVNIHSSQDHRGAEISYPRFSKRERMGPTSPRCEMLVGSF